MNHHDVRRIAARSQVVGTELEEKGPTALGRLQGWVPGPVKAPAAAPEEVCGCGHGAAEHTEQGKGLCAAIDRAPDGEAWPCWCNAFVATAKGTAGDDRREERRQAARAGEHYAEMVADLRLLDEVLDRIEHRLDIACPPTMEALRNRRTGEFDPQTATDVLAAGGCPNCFEAGIGFVPLPEVEGSGSVRRYADRCRPCGDFRKANDGLDKPKELVRAHHDNRRLNAQETEAIIKAARDRANPKKSKGKGKRKKAA